jgi:hypothetical protein
VRELVVGAWQRLASHVGMTQPRFCAALALPARRCGPALADVVGEA